MPDALSELTGGLFSAESLQLSTHGKLTGLPPHPRTQIRDYVVGRLRGIVLDGNRVEPSRQLPVTDTELPKILVYTNDEQSEEYHRSPFVIRRQLALVIDICAGEHRFLDRLSDELGWVIEQRLMQDPSLGGLVQSVILARSEKAIVEDHSIDLVLLRLTFQVLYTTEHSELVPDDLELIRTTMDFAPKDNASNLVDEVELPVTEGP